MKSSQSLFFDKIIQILQIKVGIEDGLVTCCVNKEVKIDSQQRENCEHSADDPITMPATKNMRLQILLLPGYLAANDCQNGVCQPNVHGITGENVGVQNDEIGQITGLEPTLVLFPEFGVGRAERIGIYCVGYIKTFGREEPFCRCAGMILAGDG